MRDGVKLETLFFMPNTDGPWTVLVSRSPYPRNRRIYDYQGKIFSERGYGFVCQYSRGVAGSEGDWTPFETERADGEDFLRWLEDQPYVKEIGLYGYSYVSFTQWILLDCLTPKVKTAYLVHFGTDRYHQMYCNGLFRHDIYTPWAKDNAGVPPPPYQAAFDAGLYKPHIEADRVVFHMDLPWYREWISHPGYDSYWTESFWETLKNIPSKISIPVFIGCGWYDHHFDGMMRAYAKLPDDAKAHARLLIGPWNHMKNPAVDAYDVSDAFFSGIHGYEGALQWMDNVFKKAEPQLKGILAYEIGCGWKELPAWPGETRLQQLFLTQTGLSPSAPTEEGELHYTYDPNHFIETNGSECMCYAPPEKRGSVLQKMCLDASERITLKSDPLDAPLTIRGKIRVHLRVATDAEDTAFVVRVLEGQPDGRVYNIRTGATTLRYRNDTPHALDYLPGQVVDCELVLWDIYWHLCTGSRIYVEIASSSYPEYNIHCNTAEPWAFQKEKKCARQRIILGGKNASRLEIPVEE